MSTRQSGLGLLKKFAVSTILYLLLMHLTVNAAEINRIYAGTAKVDYTPGSVPDSLILDHQYIRVIAFSDG